LEVGQGLQYPLASALHELQPIRKLAGPINPSAFLVTYLVRLPTTGLLDLNKFRLARDTDWMDDSRKKDRMYLQ